MDLTKKKVPKFNTEEEERAFWSKADSTQYVNWEKVERVTFSNLKSSIKPPETSKGIKP